MRSLRLGPVSARTVTIARYIGPLRELAPAWARLVESDQPGAPFRRFEWIDSWWRAMGAGRQSLVLVARARDEVIGILPLYAERTLLGGRRQCLMGNGIVGSDYLGIISRAGHAAQLADAFAAHLKACRFEELQLDDLGAENELIAALAAREPSLSVTRRFTCPFTRLDGSFDAFLSRRPGGTGAQWRRRHRWLERNAGLRIEELAAPDDVARGLQILVDLHRDRWASEGGSDAIPRGRIERFHRDAAGRLAALGWARVFVLHAGGAPRAALYGWVHGRRFTYYQSGRDPAWQHRSVGTVLLGSVIQRCFEEGLTELDFLRGNEAYKAAWSTGHRETLRVERRAEGLRGFLDHLISGTGSTLRGVPKRWLSPAAMNWLRVQRRRLAGATR